jgi:hypothetical protein
MLCLQPVRIPNALEKEEKEEREFPSCCLSHRYNRRGTEQSVKSREWVDFMANDISLSYDRKDQ